MPVRDMPWTDRFDAAVLYDTLHHFDDEVETLRVIQRTLVPGRPRSTSRKACGRRPGSEAEQTLIAEMEQYGTLESPFDPEYLVEVLEQAGFEDVTRFARIDELFEIGRSARRSQQLEPAAALPRPEHDRRREAARPGGEDGGLPRRGSTAHGAWEDGGDGELVMWLR